MKNILIIFLILLLASCAKYDQKHIIKNASESQTIVLKNNNKGNVHSIYISGSGFIKGDAKIILMLNEKPYKIEKVKGNVSFEWGGDWYSEKATIIYTTSNVTEGNLVIEYNFETI